MRARKVLLVGIAGLIGFLAIMFAVLQTPPGQRSLAVLVSDETVHVKKRHDAQ